MKNRLRHERSPYLLQHASNPVNWYPWGQEALDRARAEHKLIIISIGYSACHWCHVMEHESFEDHDVAEIMNTHFISIKIDREERPDIDQVYMIAVQLMTGSGGWPMNCICLPDQRPVYGGTYFRKDDWKNLLLNLAEFWRDKPEEAMLYAERLTDGIGGVENPLPVETGKPYSTDDLKKLVTVWKRHIDPLEGGYNRAPKFPLPSSWQFMLAHGALTDDQSSAIIAQLTLQKMAHGGIYDHIGGGFARYAVDGHWHVPHFEKMLYDNAQLVSLYSDAYSAFADPLYKEVAAQTVDWLLREMTSPEGGFYSALDADSEGKEGKFYTFTREELREILGPDEPVFSAFYHVTYTGNWEEEATNIFFRDDSETEIAAGFDLSVAALRQKVNVLKEKVLAARALRIRPGLDNKLLAGWNGLMLKALTDAYSSFADKRYLRAAERNARFLLETLVQDDFSIRRTPDAGTAFLDDYAFVIQGFIGLYEVTFDDQWLGAAKGLTGYVFDHFQDETTGLFYYTPANGERLIARKFELMDNVIPSSNSVMAHNLLKLGHFYSDDAWLALPGRMLATVYPELMNHPSSYANWARLLLFETYGIWEIAITGPAADRLRTELAQKYIPNKIILGGTTSALPLLADKTHAADRIYVCRNRSCRLPVATSEEAFQQIFNPELNQ